MAKIVTVAQMRRIEQAADAGGWSYDQMMLRAGQAVAQAVLDRLPRAEGKQVLILVGPGNNGGDGLVAGARLAERGMQVSAYLVRPRPSPDPHAARLQEVGGRVLGPQDEADGSLERLADSSDVLIDAVLGTGFALPMRADLAAVLLRTRRVIERRHPRPLCIAVDCPSGLACDTGAVDGAAIAADVTVTLAAAKPGLLRFPGAGYAGEIVVGDIGLKSDLKELVEVQMEMAEPKTVQGWLPRRPADAHKGTFGTAVIAGGSVNYPGSVGLAGAGAYRVGTGLVCLAVPGTIYALLVALLPEATWLILPQEMGVIAEGGADVLRTRAVDAQALLIGPGFGREETSRKFLGRLLQPAESSARGRIGFIHGEAEAHADAPPLPQLVIDADGLRLLAQLDGWPARLPAGTILTPHPGEMATLTGLETGTIQANREGVARDWALQWGHVVVLKGAHTVVAAPDGRAWVLPFATAALAKAGTGDVLAGAIAGFCAQGVPAAEASALAAYVHGRAGVLAAQSAGSTAGVLAGDVARHLPAAMAELEASPA